MMVASTMLPQAAFSPCAYRWRFSSKCRKRRMVAPSGAASRPKSKPAKQRMAAESYMASSAAGSVRSNHCCERLRKVDTQLALKAGRLRPWDNVARLPCTDQTMAPRAPCRTEMPPAARAWCAVQKSLRQRFVVAFYFLHNVFNLTTHNRKIR